MTHEYTRREVDYSVWLTAKVAAWESANRAAAAQIRLTAQRDLGMHVPPTTRTAVLVLEQEFRARVRDAQGWPNLFRWMRGEE
jgi:hypothetical protein